MIRLYGASDDLVYIEGMCILNGNLCEEAEEFYADDNDGLTFNVGDCLVVRIEYGFGPGSTWGARINMTDEGTLVPWTVAISTGDDERDDSLAYTVIVLIDCPEDTEVTTQEI